MRDLLQESLDLIDELLESEERSRPEPRRRPDDVRSELDLSLPRRGLEDEEVLRRLRAVIRMTPKTSSRRFFNQLFAGREPMAGVAEMVAGLLNSSMYTYKAAGIQVLIELTLTRRMAELAGFPEGEGTSVPGGSIANLVALVLARNEALPAAREEGVGGRPLTVYLSDQGHYSIRKNAGILGLGRSSVRPVSSDAAGRMEVSALGEAIAADRRRGALPIAVVATSGTTVLGAFDPLREIAAVTREHGIWLHVDAAFGGSFLLHPEHRCRLDGVELADSVSWNPHKMMGVPLPCSFVLVRRPGLLHRHFNETADYLFQQDSADLNLGTQSILCGRRNDALKLWAAWQSLGDDGWRRRIDRQVALARHAAEQIERRSELQLACVPECLNVCFQVAGASSAEICRRLDEEGSAMIGYGSAFGRSWLRLVTVNPAVGRRDLDRLLDDVVRVGAEVAASSDSLGAEERLGKGRLTRH